MSKYQIFNLFLIFSLCLSFGCNKVGKAEFSDTNAPGASSGGNNNGGGSNIDPQILFSGITHESNKSHSQVTIHWVSHPDAVAYDIFSIVNSSLVLIHSLWGGSHNQHTLSNLTPDTTYTYRVRLRNQQGQSDGNTNDFLVTTNPAPSCPEGYSEVPENTDLSIPVFCVMKYEAKAQKMNNGMPGNVHPDGQPPQDIYHPINNPNGYRPISEANNKPWRYINAYNAKNACLNLGIGYDLISNGEWMALARNIEADPRNWSSGVVGQDCLFQGNGNSNTNCLYKGPEPDSGENRNSKARHFLSNNQEIWDLSGNLWEWTDFTHPSLATSNYQTSPLCYGGEFSSPINCVGYSPDDYMPANPGGVPQNAYNSNYGLGVFSGGSSEGFFRGGSWMDHSLNGIFSIYKGWTPGNSGQNVGFRCVFRP